MKTSCLVLYSSYSGKRSFQKEIEIIKNTLESKFDVLEFHSCISLDDFKDQISRSCRDFSSLIVCGGDGTFNFAVNELMKYEKVPVLGYLNFGTLGDVGKNFGVSKNIKKSLKIILKGNYKSFDIGKVNDKYFVYMASIGAFADIASKDHRKLGKLTYYLESFKKVFKKEMHEYVIKIGDSIETINCPFAMILNGKFVGGFKINRKSSMSDNLMEFYYSKSRFLNSIPSYFINKRKVKCLKVNKLFLQSIDKKPFNLCLDGELSSAGFFEFSTSERHLNIYTK